MQAYQEVLKTLEDWQINYQLVDHPPALTTEEADSYIEGIDGVRTKTLFLSDKKSRVFFLIVMDAQKRMEMSRLAELLDVKGVKFCSAETLMKKLHLKAGIVSIFGLLNNAEKDVNVVLDKAIMHEARMSFHVNDNTKTVFISTQDMCHFIQKSGFEYRILEL